MFIDFEYNGVKLSDFGMSVMFFDRQSISVNVANEITSSNIYAPGTDERLPINMVYDDVFELEFSVGNFTCDTINNIESMDLKKINTVLS